MSDQVRETIRKYALQNAVFFKSKANPKAVIGKVLGEVPELRSRSAEVREIVDEVVAEVNSMSPDAQVKALEAIDPSLLVKEKKEREEMEAEEARIAAANRKTEYEAIMEADKATGKKRGLVFESDLFDEMTSKPKGGAKPAAKAAEAAPKAPAKRGKLFDTSDFDFSAAPKKKKVEEKPAEPAPKPKPAARNKPLFGDAQLFPDAGSSANTGDDGNENESLFDDF